MTRKDTYPENIEFEINREGVKSLTLHTVRVKMMSILGFVTFFFLTIPVFKWWCETSVGIPIWGMLCVFALMSVLGIGVTWLATWPLSLLWSRYAESVAANYKISVRGAFLLIEAGTKRSKESRLLHFRSIVDYAHHDAPNLRKHGIESISMETIGGGANSARTVLVGLKNARAVRDQLAEIDALREGSLG